MKTILLLSGLALASATAFGQKSYTRQLSVVDPCIGTAINPIQVEFSFQLFPNPTKGIVVVETSEIADAILLDLNGAIVRHRELSGRNEWDLGDLSAGIYILTLKTNSSISRTKLILEK